jgi:ATP-dependent exoDNAse (exonuclease V) beta subunit
MLIDILSLLDNFEQDVPLCSALLSSMGGLDLNDLSSIRLAFKEENFFRRACKKYAEIKQDKTAAKLRSFFSLYQRYREITWTW